MGVAGMFTYLTGFRAAEVRPYHISGISDDGVMVVSAKRKLGEAVTRKLRKWSPRLRVVVERAKRERKVSSVFLFPNRRGWPYTKSGWNSVWQDAMYSYIGEKDETIAQEFKAKKAREAAQRKGENVDDLALKLTKRPAYFSLLDIRPTAITKKLEKRAADAYDFAAHTNPSTTHRHYDRRRTKIADATE
ncbi:phage-related integrase [Pandoraea communis]|uniref:Phage-related integrase n=2 Tax=Pandoraea communis TaxID=2508297 RepID=A0A5E4VIQ8_9BURK|nr:phage-related integrase [Pandoraea communis]